MSDPTPTGVSLTPEQETAVKTAARALVLVIRTYQPGHLKPSELTQAAVSCASAAVIQAAMEDADAESTTVFLATGMGIGGLVGQLGAPLADACARLVIRGIAIGVDALTPPNRRADA